MKDIVIVDVVWILIGCFCGSLVGVCVDYLGVLVIGRLLECVDLFFVQVDDVIFGCVIQIGEQLVNIVCIVLFGVGWLVIIFGLIVDCKCGFGEVVVYFVVGLIVVGFVDIVVVGGVENMSWVLMGSNCEIYGEVFGWMVSECYELISQGEVVECMVDKWLFSCDELDDYVFVSYSCVVVVVDVGYFVNEIVEVLVEILCEYGLSEVVVLLWGDEIICCDMLWEKLVILKISFCLEIGCIMVGNFLQIFDGVVVLLLMLVEIV